MDKVFKAVSLINFFAFLGFLLISWSSWGGVASRLTANATIGNGNGTAKVLDKMVVNSNTLESEIFQVKGKNTDSRNSTVLFGDYLDINTGTGRTKVVVGNTTGISEVIVGQSSTNGILFNWIYNSSPYAAYGNIETWGYNNQLRINGKDVIIQNASSGKIGLGTAYPAAKIHLKGDIVFESFSPSSTPVQGNFYLINSNNADPDTIAIYNGTGWKYFISQ